MAKVLVKRFLNSSKEGNWDLVDKYGHDDFSYVLYEVELLVELDTKTGKSRVVGCAGKMLGEKEY